MEIRKENFEEGFQDLEKANREEMVMSRYNLLYNIFMIKSVLVLRNLRAKWSNSLPEYGRDVDPFSHWNHRENILFSTTPHVRFEAWFGVLMQKYSPKAISEVFILYSVLPNSSDHFTCKDGGASVFKLNYL